MTNLTHIMPCFIVSDLKKSVAFYTNQLGFKIQHIGPVESPYWAMVGRDEISIFLKVVAENVRPISNRLRHEWAPCDAYVSVIDPKKLVEEFRSNNVSFTKPLHNSTDNINGFEIEDADGYVLFFGRPN